MSQRSLLAALVAICCAGMAQAGAWPREKGHAFFSTDVRLSWPQDLSHWASSSPTQYYYTAYLEYGLSDRVTLGFDLGRSVSGDNKTIVFAQFPLRQADTGPRVSVALGLGTIGQDTVLRPGLYMGWGLKKGWFTIDSTIEFGVSGGKADYKIDVTWGRNLARDRKLIVQLQTGDTAIDPPFARLATSTVFPLGKRTKVELGNTWGLVGDTSMGLIFGLWTEF